MQKINQCQEVITVTPREGLTFLFDTWRKRERDKQKKGKEKKNYMHDTCMIKLWETEVFGVSEKEEN